MRLISGSINTAAQLSAQPTRYDWQPPARRCAKIMAPPLVNGFARVYHCGALRSRSPLPAGLRPSLKPSESNRGRVLRAYGGSRGLGSLHRQFNIDVATSGV